LGGVGYAKVGVAARLSAVFGGSGLQDLTASAYDYRVVLVREKV